MNGLSIGPHSMEISFLTQPIFFQSKNSNFQKNIPFFIFYQNLQYQTDLRKILIFLIHQWHMHRTHSNFPCRTLKISVCHMIKTQPIVISRLLHAWHMHRLIILVQAWLRCHCHVNFKFLIVFSQL